MSINGAIRPARNEGEPKGRPLDQRQGWREAAALNSAMLDSDLAHVTILNEHGTIVAINLAWSQFARDNGGSPASTGVGVNYLDVCRAAVKAGDDQAAAVIAGIESLLDASCSEYSFEYPCHSPTEQRWFSLRATPLRGPRPGAILTHLPVTQVRQADLARRQAESRYRNVVEHALEGIFQTAFNDRFAAINPAGSRMLGYDSPEQLLAEQPSLRSLYVDQSRQDDFLRDLKRNGVISNFEFQARQRDGGLRWLSLNARVITTADGVVTGVEGMVTDITEREEVEALLREKELRFRALVQHVSDIITVFRADGTLSYVSPAVEAVLGYRPDELLDQDASYLIHRSDLGKLRRVIEASPGRGGVLPAVALRLRHRDGSWRICEAVANKLFHEPGVRGIIVTWRDITSRAEAESMRAHLAAIVESSDDAIISKTLAGVVTSWNAGAERLYGYAAADAIGRSIALIMPADRQVELAELLAQVQQGQHITHFETVRERRDGTQLTVSLSLSPIRDANGVIVGAAAIARDITERRRMEELLKDLAYRDVLTGLPNRAHFLERLAGALQHAKESHQPVALLLLDLDRFKGINDAFGHPTGDDLLVAVGMRLRECMRSGDTLARLGGDEFVVLLENITCPADATNVANCLLEALRAPFDLKGQERFVSTSIGIVLSAGAHSRPDELLAQADLALYRAKDSGKDQAVLFQAQMSEAEIERLELENGLRRALERNELRVVYQPQVDLITGEIVGAEALMRWQHPERGLLLPATFIALAEETGLIVPIGAWVLQEACRQAEVWQRTRPTEAPFLMAVNLSAKQFEQPGLVELVAAALAETGLPPSCLELEITESIAMHDVDACILSMHALKALGVCLAIDDFGTGYSSLSYLRRFPLDTLKIDGSFISELGRDAGALAIAHAVTALAHTLGMEVTAEGIETLDHLACVRSVGCERDQGYLFAQPLAPSAMSSLRSAGAIALPEPAARLYVVRGDVADGSLSALNDCVTHELTAPLATLSTHVQILQRRAARLATPRGSLLKNQLNQLERVTMQVHRQIEELLTLSDEPAS